LDCPNAIVLMVATAKAEISRRVRRAGRRQRVSI
jgi:hypothetical protein